MSNLTLKEFISELNARLEKFSHDELKEIIRGHAMNLPPRERRGYLDRFVRPEKPKGTIKSTKPTMTDGEFLLREIEAFGQRAENYEYTTGWGWDDDYGEERAWGDDSWVEEIGSLFERINDFYEAGDYALAKKAYEKLFEIYLAGNEEGRFSGHDQDEMVGTDLEEAGLKYLRSIYLSEKPSSRPEALLRGINTLSYLSQNTTIHGVIHASMEDLPELDQFGKHWIEYLNKQKENRIVTNLVKEAVRLFEGVKGLEALALEKGHQFPGAFVEWLEALKNDKNYRAMIRVARLGLEKLSDRLVIRARIADYLHEAANQLDQKDLIEESLKEAVYASPSLSRLLNLLDHAKNAQQKVEYVNGTLARLEKIRKRTEKKGPLETDFNRSPDLHENHVPESLEVYSYLLKGDYAKAASFMSPSKSLGWSSGNSPNAILVPFFLYAGWDHEKKLTTNIADLWKDATDVPIPFGTFSQEDSARGDLGKRFRDHLEKALKEFPIPGKEQEEYFLAAEKAAFKRVDAIVSEKHRKSYWKAAQLLLATAEIYWSKVQADQGQKLIHRFKEKYNRHYAFRTELQKAAKKSNLFSVL
ncbi:MAG: hypothetical protein Q7V48_01770 [Deltaproteobacteria bacterium]|nr:hypothetical protein [Deltaproteobacteria bacterium]